MVSGVRWRSSNGLAVIGCCALQGVAAGPSPPWLVDRLRSAAAMAVSFDGRDGALRDLLRIGGFRPTGRNRPAHEFLARTGAGMASILSIVDVNNIISLRHRLPASVIDADVLHGSILIREGRPGERYVFNRSGQELDLGGLLMICDDSGMPVASPVKDSLAAHVTEDTRDIVFCAYGSLQMMTRQSMKAVVDDFTELGISVAGGRVSGVWIVSAEMGE